MISSKDKLKDRLKNLIGKDSCLFSRVGGYDPSPLDFIGIVRNLESLYWRLGAT